MSKTVENLKTLKQLGFGTFKAIETVGYERSKSVWKLLKHYDKVFTDLGIGDPDEKSKLIKLLEYELTEFANAGIPDTDALVVAAKDDAYKKIKAKIYIFYGIPKLKEAARDKLTKITQGDKSANQLLIEIGELWSLAEYGEQGSNEHIREILLRGLRDQEIRLQYQLSLLPGRTPLTTEGIVAYANEFSLHRAANVNNSYRAHRVYRGGRNQNRGRGGGFIGGRGQGRSGYQNKPHYNSNKCTACLGYGHKSSDNNCRAKGKTCNKCGYKDHFAAACFTPRGSAPRGGSAARGRNLNYGRRKFYKNKSVKTEKDNSETEPDNQNKNDKEAEDRNALASLLARSCALD